jgi:nicotinamidase-related amidase
MIKTKVVLISILALLLIAMPMLGACSSDEETALAEKPTVEPTENPAMEATTEETMEPQEETPEQPTTSALQFDPAKTALLVIDVENDVLDEAGAGSQQGIWKYAQDHNTIQNIATAIELAENQGIPIIRAMVHFRPGYPEVPDRGFAPIVKQFGMFEEGTWGSEFVSGLEPKPDHLLLEKRRYSSFHGTDLEAMLNALGVDTVMVCGVSAHVCVNNTIVGAMERDFNIIALSDCIAGPNATIVDALLTILWPSIRVQVTTSVLAFEEL